jgi:hypothetical protein
MMIKCLGMFGNFLKLVVCEAFKGPLRATKLFYTGARRHPQNLCFISILKSEIHVFMSIDMVCRLKKKLTHIHIHAGGIQLQGPTRTHTHTHSHSRRWHSTPRIPTPLPLPPWTAASRYAVHTRGCNTGLFRGLIKSSGSENFHAFLGTLKMLF